MEELKEIAKRRRKLGLTQVGLAKLADISQSLVTKVERGTIDIAFSKAQKIFKALEREERKEEITAEQIMTKSIKSVKEKDRLTKAFDFMKELRISQVPVLRGEVCVGSISEENIVNHIQKGISPKALQTMTSNEIMEDAFPTISKNAGLNEIIFLLQRNKAVLIVEKGKILGIITKADLFKTLSKD